jgi:hypothetical protein
LAFAEDRKTLMALDNDGIIWRWSLESGNSLRTIALGGGNARALSVSPLGLRRCLLNAIVSVWDVRNRISEG